MKEIRPHSIDELNRLFIEGEFTDKELFSEIRSNLQIIAGEHYAKKGLRFWNRIRDNKELAHDQKLRLTKNHVQRIIKIIKNSITSYAPGARAGAKDKSSLQHQKSAELVNSVWAWAKQEDDLKSKINEWAGDYVGAGECWVKTFWDPSKGKFIGYDQKTNSLGEQELDDDGEPVKGNPRFSGGMSLERIFAANVIRPAGAKVLSEAPWIAIRKMVDTKELKMMIDNDPNRDDEEKETLKQKISETADQTYIVLDTGNNQYRQVKNQTMVKEFYFRPSPIYPEGYFYFCIETAKIFEGPLPFGIFPLEFCGFDEIPTAPRFRSLVKQLRPGQVEINRCFSTIAEHQITLGWDKVLTQKGTKLEPGMTFPGVRGFQFSGATPIVMEGRTGDQYLTYMDSQIKDLYDIANIDMIQAEKSEQYDVYSMLARSLKDKKKFSLYTDQFQSFVNRVFKKYIDLSQKYLDDNHLVPMIGKSEYINISEFKNVPEICYQIVPDDSTDDSETKLGKQLMLSNIIQYVGPQLQRDDIGKLIRMMPYANDEILLEDLTMDFDFSTNLMLALDRGEPPIVSQYVTPEYVIKKLTNRTVKPDFKMLSPQIQQSYQQAIQMYQQAEAQKQAIIKQAQSQFIPSGGFLVACDFYIPDQANPQKLPKRVRIPSEALDWLIKQLSSQGSNQQALGQLSDGAQAGVAAQLNQIQQQAQQQQPQARAVMRPQMPMHQPLPMPTGPNQPRGMMNGH